MTAHSSEQKQALLAAIATCQQPWQPQPQEADRILQAIAALEAVNPTPAPTTATDLLEGDWKLLFTTSLELLGIDRLPLLALGEIWQCLRTSDRRVVNLAEVQSLLGTGLVSVAATFEIVSDRRLEVSFQRLVLGLERFLGYRDVATWVDRLGQDQRIWTGIDFPIQPGNRRGWIELTYLDQDLRINRGNEGSVFVLQRPTTGRAQ